MISGLAPSRPRNKEKAIARISRTRLPDQLSAVEDRPFSHPIVFVFVSNAPAAWIIRSFSLPLSLVVLIHVIIRIINRSIQFFPNILSFPIDINECRKLVKPGRKARVQNRVKNRVITVPRAFSTSQTASFDIRTTEATLYVRSSVFVNVHCLRFSQNVRLTRYYFDESVQLAVSFEDKGSG